MRTKWSMCVAALVLASAASATGWGDYIFSGADGSRITGEDGSGLTFQNRTDKTDITANSPWVVVRGTQPVVGGVTYLSDPNGKTILACNPTADVWLMNAVQLTDSREFLSLTVLNNGASSVIFDVWVEDLILPGRQTDPAYSPHYAVPFPTAHKGVLVTKHTPLLAPGESAVVTWSFFDVSDNGEKVDYVSYPDIRQDVLYTTAPRAGDWLAQFSPRVQIGGANTGSGLVTNVELSGPGVVPEPATLMLVGTGLLGGLGILRRRHIR